MRHITFLTATLAVVALAASLGGCPGIDTGDSNDPPDQNTPCDCNEPNDTNTTPPPATNKTLHERIFTEILTDGYKGSESCLACHSDEATDVLHTAHWKWKGTVTNIVDGSGNPIAGEHGKVDLINSFCIAVPSNEGRCTQCHPSYGWKDKNFDFSKPDKMDCLICHDTTGTYRKHPSANGGGGPASMMVDGNDVVVTVDKLQTIAYKVGTPSRKNCVFCHAYAGGGDNVKHPDLPSDMAAPTREMDVHMGGLNYSCQKCHTVEDHGIAGMPLHSVTEGGDSPACERCHGETNVHKANVATSQLLNLHLAKVACQTCHIPTFARAKPTKMEWYWNEAGDPNRAAAPDALGKPTYDKMKGRFVWAKNVTPTYAWYDGKWSRMIINVSDTYASAGTAGDPVVVAKPTATINTPGAKIYPFKKFIGTQPADTVNKRLVVPHLFGTAGGANPYWSKYDWGLAIADGTTYAGQPYSGTYGFVNTVMYLTVNHEIAPREQALQCTDCHGDPTFFTNLGYAQPPFSF